MDYRIVDTGGSRAFAPDHALIRGAAQAGEIVILIGARAGAEFRALAGRESARAVLIELGTECLGVHTGEAMGEEGSNVLGFSRFRIGNAEPSKLIELVRQPRTDAAAIAAAREVLERAGLTVSLCADRPGRILDRLLRPYFNDVLRRLDEGLASAEDMDSTLRWGLGYPEGPLALLERGGLTHHHDVTQSLYEQLGQAAYAPARRARVAKEQAKEEQINQPGSAKR